MAITLQECLDVAEEYTRLRGKTELAYSLLSVCDANDIPYMLEWMADRLVNVHGDHPRADFILNARLKAEQMRAIIAKIKLLG